MEKLKNERIVELYNTLCNYHETFNPEIKIEKNENTKNENTKNKNTKNENTKNENNIDEKLEKNNKNIKNINNSNNLSNLYEEIVNFNTDNNFREYSGLISKKYNKQKKQIEIYDDSEFNKIQNFILNGEEIEYDPNFESSSIGRIILEGYKRYINIEDHINIDFNEFIEFILDEKDWVKVSNDKNKDIYIKLIDDPTSYYYEYDRFIYFGTLVIKNENNVYRLVIYKDLNHDLYFPYERKIVNKFIGMFNINKNNLQLDFNQELFIYVEGNNNLIRYQINDTGVAVHSPFENYATKKNLDKLYVLETQKIKKSQ